MKKVSLIDGRFCLGQTKPGVDLAFYELYRRGLLNKLKNPYQIVLTMDSTKLTDIHWECESKWLEYLSNIVSLHYKLGNKPVTIGGDHSIGLSTVTGVLKHNPKTALVWVDAHGDFNNFKSSETGNLHGMPLNGLVYGWQGLSPVFKWIGQGIVAPSQVALFGLRDVDKEEQVLIDKAGIACWTMKDIRERSVQVCLREVNAKINPYDLLDWHVSFDLDSIDPEEFPSTGCLVPGGVTFEEACLIMKWFNDGKLKSFDIVEWNPIIASTSDCDEKLIKLINEGL